MGCSSSSLLDDPDGPSDEELKRKEMIKATMAVKAKLDFAMKRRPPNGAVQAPTNGEDANLPGLDPSRVGMSSIAGGHRDRKKGQTHITPKVNQDFAMVMHPVGGDATRLLVGCCLFVCCSS